MESERKGVSTTIFVICLVLIVILAISTAVFFFQNARCQGDALNNICPNINTNENE